MTTKFLMPLIPCSLMVQAFEPPPAVFAGSSMISFNFLDTLYSFILLINTVSRLVCPEAAKEISKPAANANIFLIFKIVYMSSFFGKVQNGNPFFRKFTIGGTRAIY